MGLEYPDSVRESVRASRERARAAITAAFGRDPRGFVRDTEAGAADLVSGSPARAR